MSAASVAKLESLLERVQRNREKPRSTRASRRPRSQTPLERALDSARPVASPEPKVEQTVAKPSPVPEEARPARKSKPTPLEAVIPEAAVQEQPKAQPKVEAKQSPRPEPRVEPKPVEPAPKPAQPAPKPVEAKQPAPEPKPAPAEPVPIEAPRAQPSGSVTKAISQRPAPAPKTFVAFLDGSLALRPR